MSHDYVYRPTTPQFKNICAHEMVMRFKKTCISTREIESLGRDVTSNNEDIPQNGCNNNSKEENTEDKDSGLDHNESSTR